jgi:energy-coupling factor transporter ATP-binding protein EcfA2
MLHNTFIQEIVLLKSRVKFMMIGCYLSCVLCLITTSITPRGINKINLSILGFISSVIGVSFSQLEDRLNLKLEDLNIQSRVTSKEIYAGLLKDNNFEITLPNSAPIDEQNIISDVVGYWRQQEKHLAIIGGTGDGKSYTIKHFISCLQSDYSISVYDVDFAKDDYSGRVDVKFDYGDIEESFINDIEELEQRIGIRRQMGKKYVPDKRFIVGEEMPALAEECESLGIWMRKMSKRGRKVGLFIAAIAQNDSASNFAIQGDYKILQSNFCLLYLNSKAKTRAKQLKNQALIEWLEGAQYGRALLDDRPCLIPSNTFQSSTDVLPMQEQLLTASTSGSAAGSVLEEPEEQFYDAQNSDFSDEKRLIYARILIAEGRSKSSVIQLLWNVTGGRRFSELARLLSEE